MLALVASGLAQPVISPPMGWVWLSLVYLVPGLWAIFQLSGTKAFLAGWLLATTANVGLFYWIADTVRSFSSLPTVVALAVLVLFSAVFGAWCGLFAWGVTRIRRHFARAWPLLGAAWFVACELLNPQLFPIYHGVAFYQIPRFFLVATVTGVAGITFQMALWNLLLAWLVERYRAREPLFHGPLRAQCAAAIALAVVSIAVSSARLQAIDTAERDADAIRVAIIQPNLDQATEQDILRRGGVEAVMQVHLDASRRALQSDPAIDVLVWPEGAVNGGLVAHPRSPLRAFVRDGGVEVWTGGKAYKRDRSRKLATYNSAYRVYGEGEVDRQYDKNILLPFGEFMPLEETFPFLGRIEGVGNFVRGDELIVYDSPKTRFCFLICYEAIKRGYVRKGVARGAALLVNVTYDGWFGDTSCPSEHLSLAAVQSAQYGVPMIRAATTGISAVIDARGVIVDQTEVFTEAVLTTDVKLVRLPTPYGAAGEWFAWGCFAICAVALLRTAIPGGRPPGSMSSRPDAEGRSTG